MQTVLTYFLKMLNYSLWVEKLYPYLAFISRIYLASVFIPSGYLKYTSWQSTLFLFSHEYQVLLLSPKLAAYLGTAAELLLPIFILLGLGARLPLLSLFIFNIVAATSYPYLWLPEGFCALKDHILWGAILAFLMTKGVGILSLDQIIQRHYKWYRY
jgi:putative oxidoreductase